LTRFALQGEAAAYFADESREVLNAGPARSGKTNAELVKAKFVAHNYPGSRQLFARETRKSLTETILPDWETKVLGRGHPMIGKARRSHRDAYHHPNGSVVVLHGLDDPENVLSGEFDRIYVFQAEQLTAQDTWDALMSRLSGRATPYVQGTLDVNPAGERHWIIRRANETLCLRCSTIVEAGRPDCQACHSTALGRVSHHQFKHTSNPLLFDWARQRWTEFGVEYLTQILGRLRGVRRKRLLEGLWVSEEGQILGDYDPAIHRISAQLEQTPFGTWVLRVTSPGWSVGNPDPMRESIVPIDWFGAGADWGFFPDPGAFVIFAYDKLGRRFLVCQVCRTSQQLDWWAAAVSNLYQEFKFRYIAVDPSAPAMKDAFNRRLALDHNAPALAISANNVIRQQDPDLAGIDLMRWGLRDPQGVVRTFFVKDSLRYGYDPMRKEAGKATCIEDEIPEWVFERKKSTGELTDRPDETRSCHVIDSARYEGNEGWGVRMAAAITAATKYPQGTAGAIHSHAEKMAKAKARGG